MTMNLCGEQSMAEGNTSEGFNAAADWRVRMSLAETANYLYKEPGAPGILLPLQATDGVIFPYTPTINVTYAATYDSVSPTH